MTGATGFLGGHFLLRCADSVACLVRAESAEAARRRILDRLRLSADGEPFDLPFDAIPYGARCGHHEGTPRAEEFWHFAGALRFEDRYRAEVFETNVEGTRRAILTALQAGCGKFVYISTAFTAGTLTGSIPERLHSPAGFHNAYEESKCAAEHLVAELCQRHRMDFQILRPGIVVGPIATHRPAGSESGLYGLLRLLLEFRSHFENIGEITLAGDPGMRLPFVPVDTLIRAMQKAGGEICHLTGDGGPLAEEAFATGARALGMRCGVRFGPAPSHRRLERVFGVYAAYYRDAKVFEHAASGPAAVTVEDIRRYVEEYLALSPATTLSGAGTEPSAMTLLAP